MEQGVSRSLRLAHKWAAIAVAAPLLIVIATGIFLQVRKPVEWIQPASERGTATFQPQVTQDQVLEAVRAVPRMEVDGWDDLLLTDYRPRKGIIKVRTPGHLETQVDATTGAVIKTGQRWNDIVMKIHDGSAFGGRLWLFLPAGIGALFLTLSGIYLGGVATARRWRLRRHSQRHADRGKLRSPQTLSQFCFKYHYWVALVVMIPWLIVVSAGLVLQLRHEIPGIEPPYKQGISTVPVIDYQQVLDIAKTIPELEVEGWSDIWRVYTHPANGIVEIRTKIGFGAQLDAASGEILDVYARAGDFWEDLHEGIFGRHRLNGMQIFGERKIDLSKWVFLPVNVIALLLWFTGIVVALRSTVGKPRPVSAPAVARVEPLVDTGAAALPLVMLEPDLGTVSASSNGRSDWDPEALQREKQAMFERRRAASRRLARQRTSEGSDAAGVGIVTKTPKDKLSRRARNRAGWRRRTG